jgi:hypothetical protein
MVTDLRAGPDGNLYAVSLGQFTEQGPVPNSGAILPVKEGDASEAVLAGLSFPTSIDFTAEGDTYFTTNGVGDPGTGELVMFKGVTSLEGLTGSAGDAPGRIPETGDAPRSDAWLLLAGGAGLAATGLLLGRRLGTGQERRE